MKLSEQVSATDLFLMIFGAFLTPKLWWISSTYNDRFIVFTLVNVKHYDT
jgi:hypothetical protein